MFKKNKKEKIDIDATSDIQEVDVEEQIEKNKKAETKQPKLTEEEQEQLNKIKEYQLTYGSFYHANDFSGLPHNIIEADRMNLNWAIYQELKKNNTILLEILKKQEE